MNLKKLSFLFFTLFLNFISINKVSANPKLDLIHCVLENGEAFFISFEDKKLSYYDDFLALKFLDIVDTEIVSKDKTTTTSKLTLENDLYLVVDHATDSNEINISMAKSKGSKSKKNGTCKKINIVDLYPN